MPSADVTNQPLAVQFTFYPKPFTAGATDNSQYQISTLPFASVEPFLPPSVQAQTKALQQMLSTPLGKVFNDQWQQSKAQSEADAVTFVQQAAQKSKASVSNIAVSLADAGTVTADVEAAATPGGAGALTLTFLLSGNEITFDDPSLVNWGDVFDITVTLATPVPLLPFGFAPSVTAFGEHAQVFPNNELADVLAAADDIATAIANFFVGGSPPYVSEVDLQEKALEQETDTALPLSNSPALAGMLTQMNPVGPDITGAGFTEFVFSIESGNVLTGTLTHPLDAGPVLVDATHPEAGGGVNFMLPELSASESVVPPGGPFSAAGHYFPLASSGQLYLQWMNTTSGTAVGAELQVTGGGSSNTLMVAPGPGFTDQYTYIATGLKPGVEYSFTARCSDLAAWSLWSEQPLKLTTSEGDLVELILQPPAGSSYPAQQIGMAALASTPDWACAAAIPASAPFGTYTLAAVLNGQTLAITPITVGTVTANIAVIDPADNQVMANPQIMADATFTIRGEAFPDGPVTITIAGQPAGTATATGGTFTAQLTANQGTYTSGIFTIAATSGGTIATTTYYQIGTAK